MRKPPGKAEGKSLEKKIQLTPKLPSCIERYVIDNFSVHFHGKQIAPHLLQQLNINFFVPPFHCNLVGSQNNLAYISQIYAKVGRGKRHQTLCDHMQNYSTFNLFLEGKLINLLAISWTDSNSQIINNH